MLIFYESSATGKAAILVYISRMPTAGFRKKIFSGAFDPCLMARQQRDKLRQKGGGHWELVWVFFSLDRTFGFYVSNPTILDLNKRAGNVDYFYEKKNDKIPQRESLIDVSGIPTFRL